MSSSVDERRAAVLVPVFVDARGEHGLVFIQRSGGPQEHAGQVGFPGGRHDPVRDESLLATALREASEEIGLESGDVRLLGALPERRTFTSGRLVSPFAVMVREVPRWRLDPREVEAVFTAGLAEFSHLGRRDRLHWNDHGRRYEVPCVRLGERVVWGLTLDIVDDLLAAAAALLLAP